MEQERIALLVKDVRELLQARNAAQKQTKELKTIMDMHALLFSLPTTAREGFKQSILDLLGESVDRKVEVTHILTLLDELSDLVAALPQDATAANPELISAWDVLEQAMRPVQAYADSMREAVVAPPDGTAAAGETYIELKNAIVPRKNGQAVRLEPIPFSGTNKELKAERERIRKLVREFIAAFPNSTLHEIKVGMRILEPTCDLELVAFGVQTLNERKVVTAKRIPPDIARTSTHNNRYGYMNVYRLAEPQDKP